MAEITGTIDLKKDLGGNTSLEVEKSTNGDTEVTFDVGIGKDAGIAVSRDNAGKTNVTMIVDF